MKKKVSRDFYHEAIDRIAIIQDNIENHVSIHPAVIEHKKVVKLINKAQYKLAKAYQLLGGNI